ncbi:uncharacterized protein JCM6883_005369 [Sporobolomyces salmoneus]|uniref:uncharacterized protein n=1 Tax=Sporobolomyces salmoneus TaxID=183962 RepID=UPI0031812888
MSNLIPSGLQQPQATPSYYTDCYSCRLTGTLTFSAVGLYAHSVARMQAKTQVGKGIASLSGLGFLAIAAARWTSYSEPPPTIETEESRRAG